MFQVLLQTIVSVSVNMLTIQQVHDLNQVQHCVVIDEQQTEVCQ